jgi:DNA-binding NtrC family response regulator
VKAPQLRYGGPVKVLLVDDDPEAISLLERLGRDGGVLTPVVVGGGHEALDRLAAGDIAVVVTAVQLFDMEGSVLLDRIRQHHPDTPVVMMTSSPSVEAAVAFLKQGADDYVIKPIKPGEPNPIEQEVFAHRVRLLFDKVRLQREVRQLKRGLASEGTPIIGNTALIQNLLRRLPMTAQTDATVLLMGESGTGKEVFARRIHELSKRSQRRFVAVNCGALSDTLLESELFGYKRGAFTDAARDTPGLVVEADGGTLFLDEIAEVSPAVQVKLLRFLQHKEYKPLGSPRTEKADIRIVAATNRELKQMVQQGVFREDLYYRLNIIPITIPPLRDRKADIPLLASFFLSVFRRQYERKATGFSAEAFARLMAHDWPGNVRELENRVQQLVVLSNDEVVRDLDVDGGEHPIPIQSEGSFRDEKKRVVAEFERDYVRRALERADDNVSEAARMAGLDRKSFWNLARRNGLHGQPRGRISAADRLARRGPPLDVDPS